MKNNDLRLGTSKRGERWVRECLSHVNFARAIGRDLYVEIWEKLLSMCPHDEAAAARAVYADLIEPGQAAELYGVSRIKILGLAGRCCKRLAEMCGRP